MSEPPSAPGSGASSDKPLPPVDGSLTGWASGAQRGTAPISSRVSSPPGEVGLDRGPDQGGAFAGGGRQVEGPGEGERGDAVGLGPDRQGGGPRGRLVAV